MNVFSQSASRAEADSGDDSELSLSLFREGSERTSFFWPNQKVYKSNNLKIIMMNFLLTEEAYDFDGF